MGQLESIRAYKDSIQEVMVGNIKPRDTDVEVTVLSNWTYLGLGRVTVMA